jgi:beta-lactamase class A
MLLAVVFLLAALAPANVGGSAAVPAAALPATQAGESLAWALDTVNGGAGDLTGRELRRWFAPDFLAALPPSDLISIFQLYLAPSGPMRLARFEGPTDGPRVRAILVAPGSDWRVTLGVQPADGRIVELFFEPVGLPARPAKPPTNWVAFDKQIRKVAPRVSFMAAEITGGACEPIHAFQGDRSLAVGSNFKLYVLGALGEAVAAGAVGWDDPLTISDEYRSLPSGELFRMPTGTVFPVRYVAEQMMSVSDNTATDHLIGLLGRETVEATMGKMGHHDPALNQPLLLTREWFAIKLRFTAKQVTRYLGGTAEERRAMLAEEAGPAASTLSELDDWPGPYLVDTVEWFASAADLCRAAAYLHEQSQLPGLGEVADALSMEPGLPFSARDWSYVGYKGGYETGVKSDVWLLQRADGRWFALAAIINDPAHEIDGYSLASLSVAAVDLLASHD